MYYLCYPNGDFFHRLLLIDLANDCPYGPYPNIKNEDHMNSVISKNATVAERVKTIMHEKLGLDESVMVDTATFSDDLGLDSLDVLETFMAIEKEFNIKISDDDAERLRTVGSVIDYIATHVRR